MQSLRFLPAVVLAVCTSTRQISGILPVMLLAIALCHGIEMEHIDYIQIHPTTLYSEKPGRRFLISESVRGEGAILLDKISRDFVMNCSHEM